MKEMRIEGRLAVFSDVHGNLPALEAVLADIERRGVPNVLCLGDLVGYGPFPNEVAQRVRDLGIATVMGNYDRGIGFQTGDCGCVYKTDVQRAEGAASLAWTQKQKCGSCHTTFPYMMSRAVLKDAPSTAMTEVRAFGHCSSSRGP